MSWAACSGMVESSHSKMVISSKTSEMSAVEEAVLNQARAYQYPEQVLFGVRLALEEALANAIKHGNAGDPDRKVTVDYSVDRQRIHVAVWDEGYGFAPEQLPDPRQEEHLTQPHGRGVLLMRAYMDEVHFNERGNCVTLIKYRSEPGAGAGSGGCQS